MRNEEVLQPLTVESNWHLKIMCSSS